MSRASTLTPREPFAPERVPFAPERGLASVPTRRFDREPSQAVPGGGGS